jgi:dipeptidyl aminopeptidase/acylaminoacyl peptidase
VYTTLSKKCLPIIAASIGVFCCQAQNRKFTVRDSIEMTTFSEPPHYIPNANAPASPDGKRFAIVTSRGILKSNQIESTVRIFDTESIERFLNAGEDAAQIPAGKLLARMVSVPVAYTGAPYSPLISDLRWAKDSQSLYFLAQNAAGQHYLCNVNIKTGRTAALSPRTDYDVERYSVGDRLALFVAIRLSSVPPSEQLPGEKINADASDVTGQSIDSILFPHQDGQLARLSRELWISRAGRSHLVKDASAALNGNDMVKYLDVLSISPDNRFAIRLMPVDDVPATWQTYLPLKGFEDWRANLTNKSPVNYWKPQQYVLVDLASEKVQRLLDAPLGGSLAHLEATEAVWSDDGKRILLTNTFLPLDGADAATREKRANICAVAEMDLPTRETRCIASSRDAGNPTVEYPDPLRLQDASFGETSDEVVVHLGWPRESRYETDKYKLSNGEWKVVRSDKGAIGQVKSIGPDPKDLAKVVITVKQGLNDPPILWARDVITGKEREIWNPNPQLRQMKMGEASVYRWKNSSGEDFIGGLVKPIDYVPGRRYPLVIQTHGFQESEFITDGPFPTAMAARPLSSEGIVVLQVGSNHLHYDEATEAHEQVTGYASAIDKLASEGIVDPARVGIIGFSRTCWYVETALIERPTLFATASITDGIDQSYMQSLLYDADNVSDTQRVFGGTPFGEGLKNWIEKAPGFHLDKVRSPLLITAIKPTAILEEWEIYSSLYQQKKPVDFLYIPNGQHVLQKPLDRFASQQTNVDWFTFWLLDYERPQSEDPEAYKRWEHLRELRGADSSKQTPTKATP